MNESEKNSPFTYPEVGSTATELPTGYQHLRAQRIVGQGQELFEECGKTILSWGIQKGAGFRLQNSDPVVVNGKNRLGLHWGPFITWADCQVVYVLDEPNRKGFAYGTIKGHPERGEESFIVSIDKTGQVIFEITAFSKPERWFARLGGPTVRFLQQHVTWKYLDSIHQPSVRRNIFLAATKRFYESPDKKSWVRTNGPRND